MKLIIAFFVTISLCVWIRIAYLSSISTTQTVDYSDGILPLERFPETFESPNITRTLNNKIKSLTVTNPSNTSKSDWVIRESETTRSFQTSTLSPTRSSTIRRKNGNYGCQIISGSHCKASADVRGNLGPPEVILNEKVSDWLNDRYEYL